MRRKRRKRLKIFRTCIYILLFVVIAFTITSAYSYMTMSLGIDGLANIVKTEENTACTGNVTYDLTSWNNGNNLQAYRMTITLTNTGDKAYNDWDIYFDIPEDFSLVSNSSSEIEILGNKVKIGSVFYNSYLQSGSSINFEIQFTTSDTNYEPTNIMICDCYLQQSTENTTNNLNVDFQFVTKNGVYTYQYNVIVTNAGNATITSWTFNMRRPNNVDMVNVWDANYIVKDDYIEFSNVLHNGTLSPGQSASFGMMIYTDEYQYTPSLYE